MIAVRKQGHVLFNYSFFINLLIFHFNQYLKINYLMYAVTIFFVQNDPYQKPARTLCSKSEGCGLRNTAMELFETE